MTERLVCTAYAALAYLPTRFSTLIARFVVALVWIFGRRMVRVVYANLAIAYPQLAEKQRRALAHQSLVEMTISAIQTPYIWKNGAALVTSKILSIHGEHLIHELQASTRGAILITPHLGCWEFLGLYMSTQVDLMILYKPHRINCLRKLTESSRQLTGAKLATTDRLGLARLARHLKSGGCAGLLPDQVPMHDHGVFAPFFGRPAFTTTLVGSLARRYQLPVYAACAIRRSKGYELYIEEVNLSLNDTDDARITGQLNQHIESLIARCPEQYNWGYKRFRRSIEGTSNPYR